MRYQKSFDFAEIHNDLKNTRVKFPDDTKFRGLFIY